MIETIAGIKDWADTVFGDVSLQMNLARANEELAELITQCVMKKPLKDIAEECADIGIVLVRSVHITAKTETPEFDFQMTEPIKDMNHYYVHNPDPYTTIMMYALSVHKHLEWCMLYLRSTNEVRERLDNIYSLLECMCLSCGTFLNVEIDAKMVINRARQWNITGQGTGYHVK